MCLKKLFHNPGICFIFALFFIGTTCSKEPSFDCSTAKNAVEELVCDDSELSNLDMQVEKAYEKALNNAKNPLRIKRLKRLRLNWLKKRNACRDKSCLIESYKSYLSVLETKALPKNLSEGNIDCSNSKNITVNLICTDKELFDMNEKLELAYIDALAQVNDPSEFKRQHKEWIQDIYWCMGEKSCVKTKYRLYLTAFETYLTAEKPQQPSKKSVMLSENIRKDIVSKKPTSITSTQIHGYKFNFLKDTDRKVCSDLLKNYNKLLPPMESFACEIQFDPSMPQFSWPKWQELNIENYLDVIYAIESHILPGGKEPPFEVWRTQYLADMTTGLSWRKAYGGKLVRASFYPRLRQTKVRFATDGRLETVLGYTRDRLAAERCKYSLKKCPLADVQNTEAFQHRRDCVEQLNAKWGIRMDHPGDHIFLYEPGTRYLRFISPGDRGAGASSILAEHLFIYQDQAYLALVTVSGISVSRVERVESQNPAIKPGESGRQICNILPVYPKTN